MKFEVKVEGSLVLRSAPQVQSLPGLEPLLDGAVFRVMDGAGGALAEAFVAFGGEQKGHSPAHVAGNCVAPTEDRLGDVRNRGHRKILGLVSPDSSEDCGEM